MALTAGGLIEDLKREDCSISIGNKKCQIDVCVAASGPRATLAQAGIRPFGSSGAARPLVRRMSSVDIRRRTEQA